MPLEDGMNVTLAEIIRDYWHVFTALVLGAVGYADLRSTVQQLKESHKELCKKAESDLKEVEGEIGLRISNLEINHGKLQELIYRSIENVANKVESVTNLVQDVKASVKEIEGYERARRDFNDKHPTARR